MKQVLFDIWMAISDEWNFVPDPKRHAKTPPQGWHLPTPEAYVPSRKASSAEVDLDVWTAEEILEMTALEYAQKCGTLGVMSYKEALREAQKQVDKNARKGNAKQVKVEF